MILLLALSGCVYRVQLQSNPSSVIVQLPDGNRVSTPHTIDVPWRPFGEYRVVATAAGYRPLEVDLLARNAGRFRLKQSPRPPPGLELLLIPEHGPAGTWVTPE